MVPVRHGAARPARHFGRERSAGSALRPCGLACRPDLAGPAAAPLTRPAAPPRAVRGTTPSSSPCMLLSFERPRRPSPAIVLATRA
jgi:hypothetical protein